MSTTTAGVSDPRTHDTASAAGGSGGTRPLTDTPRLASERHDSPLIRRLNFFWLATIVAMLVFGCASANHDQPALWRSWRGSAMVLVSLGVVGWYLLFPLIGSCLDWHDTWPSRRRIFYAHLGAGFVLVALLLLFSPSFASLLFALMGASAVILSFRESLLPVGVAILMDAWASGALPPAAHGQTWSDVMGGLFALASSVGIIYALTALIRERFQRERLFHELSEAHQRLRLSAAREADLATLRERNRLAREMHDSLGHALVSISIKLEAAQLLSAVDAGRAAAELDETTALVRSTMTDLRHSLAGLRPAALEEQPLAEALAGLACEMGRRTGVAATCSVDERASLLNRATQEALYRVGQEALTNVAKHAHAQRVTMALTLYDRRAVLEIADDWVGLDAAARDGDGADRYGVRGMRERVEALGGTLTLGPRPEGGAVLRATIPTKEGL